MPTIRRKARHRRKEWGMGHISQLAFGWDFFHDAWGDPSHLPMDQRDGWPDAEVLADMQACYEKHRSEVEAKQTDGEPTWASLVFDQGMSDDEAREAMILFREHQHELRRAERAANQS